MPRGLSLHIGLNSVDPGHYQGWSGELLACEADARDMEALARGRGFRTKTLLTAEARRQAVIEEIDAAARALVAGDAFLLTYSGHGGALPDSDGDELDAQDETWCLFDREWVDDELYSALGGFRAGVRVLSISDSCHSGTVVKAAYYHGTDRFRASPLEGGERVAYRAMPAEIAQRVYRANRDHYDPILARAEARSSGPSVQASVLLLSGCQDNQLSADGAFNGRFTAAMLRVWADGRFSGSYRNFHESIVARMPPDQTPNYYLVGAPNPGFEAETPFTI